MRGLGQRVAIVTGAGQGIGQAITERLLAEGARVLAVDKAPERLAALPRCDELITLAVDLTDDHAPATVIGHCMAAFGGLDILVNNAGLGNAPSLHETTDALYDLYLDVNLRQMFRLSRDAIPALRQRRGCIVNMASAVGLSGLRGLAAYGTAKAGVIGLTRCAAAEYGPEGIRVNAVAPGVIATPATAGRLGTARFQAAVVGTMPLGRTGNPADVAAAVAFLASDDAAFITGQILAVDGGQTATVFISEDIVGAWERAQNT